jgi:recombination associated protein RdgC
LGALKGSISYSKHYVRGALPDDFRDPFVERVRLRAFRPLGPEEDEVRVGWCSIENPLDCELDHGKIYYNAYLNLGLRVDRWQIPGPLFKAHFAEAEREHLAKKGRAKLGKSEKEELAARVSRKLRKQLVPAMKAVDLSWNLDTGVVRFWSQSPALVEALGEIFEATFGLDLVPESPFTAAARIGISEAHERAFATLLPSTFNAPLS